MKKEEWKEADCSFCKYHTEFKRGSLCRRFPPTINHKTGAHQYPRVHIDYKGNFYWRDACAEYKK